MLSNVHTPAKFCSAREGARVCLAPFTTLATTARPNKRGTYSIAAAASNHEADDVSRRAFIANCSAAAILGSAKPSTATEEPAAEPAYSDTNTVERPPDTTITHKVFLDVGVCRQVQSGRTLGDKAFCTEPEQLGRIVIGLYGNTVPATVHNFLELVKDGAYNSTLFNKVMPGEYIAAGKQGSVRMGEVSLTSPLQPNKDLMASGSYRLDHRRAGTVSLNLSQSLDDPSIQQTSAYRNVGFFITTGPGPASSLDGTNVVFGRVLQGMDTVARVTAVPTFKPVNDRLLALNKLGSMLGDERAAKTRKKWGRPLQPVLITATGILA